MRSSPRPTKFDLYSLCVQSPLLYARFLRAIHGRDPRILREDFSGAAAICSAWLELDPRHAAIAVDMDPAALRHARPAKRLRRIARNVLAAPHKADMIAALNFPIGYWHTRPDLLRYLTLSRRRLREHGALLIDTYGGRSAFTTGTTRKRLRAPAGQRITYEWEQRQADPVSGLVHNAIHFTINGAAAGRPRTLRNAFTYHWRLWSIPELTDAMHEAGFTRVDVYDRLGDAIDSDGNLYVRPVQPGEPLDDDWVAYLAARV